MSNFIHRFSNLSFIYSINKYSLSVYYLSVNILKSRNTAVKKIYFNVYNHSSFILLYRNGQEEEGQGKVKTLAFCV